MQTCMLHLHLYIDTSTYLHTWGAYLCCHGDIICIHSSREGLMSSTWHCPHYRIDTATAITCRGVLSGLRRCLTRRHRCSRASIPSPTRWANHVLLKQKREIRESTQKRILGSQDSEPWHWRMGGPGGRTFCCMWEHWFGFLPVFKEYGFVVSCKHIGKVLTRTSRNQKALSKPPTMQRQKHSPRSSRVWTARSGLVDWICRISKMKNTQKDSSPLEILQGQSKDCCRDWRWSVWFSMR